MELLQKSLVWIIIISIIGLISLGIISGEKKWERYKIEHHCILNGHKESTVGMGIGLSGGQNSSASVVPVIIPEQQIYTCDNGEIIIK